MATTENELVDEIRDFTGYTSTTEFSDQDITDVIQVGKEELRADFGAPDFTFFDDSHTADRALFWFACLGLKVRAGEIGGMSITIDELEAIPQDSAYHFWSDNLAQRRREAAMAQVSGSVVSISRDGRTYGDQ